MTSAYETGIVPAITVRHRMRIAREAAGLEQAELAQAMGISRQSVSSAESGKTTPRKITVNAWALATGVPVTWLETGKVPHPDNDPDGGLQYAVGGSNPGPADLEPCRSISFLSPRSRRVFNTRTAA